MRHTANHGLPVSAGYGRSNDGEITVYCGRCKGTFEADADWAQRYLDTRTRELDKAAADPSPYGIRQARRDLLLAEQRAEFAKLLAEVAA